MNPPIKDSIASLPVSRQRKYQLRQKLRGKCMRCGKKSETVQCSKCHRKVYKRIKELKRERVLKVSEGA